MAASQVQRMPRNGSLRSWAAVRPSARMLQHCLSKQTLWPPAGPEEPFYDPPPSINDWRPRPYASPSHAAFDAYARASQAMGSVTYSWPPRK
jgi:hypothetical protein